MRKILDLVGNKYGNLSVIAYAGKYKLGGSQWQCQCDCGNFVIIRAQHLKSGNSKRCGCCASAPDIKNIRFGRLTALSLNRTKNNSQYWLFICDCGNQTEAKKSHVTSGKIKSCGCLAKEQTKKRFTTHGMTGTTEYYIWTGMMQRCYNKNHHKYNNYGGRGITVCDRWHNFPDFLSDMGMRPAGLSLDRKNNDGNYNPENCRWATGSEQANNRRCPKPHQTQEPSSA